MRKQCDDYHLDKVKAMVAKKLDWNLSNSEILGYRVTSDGRMQVVLLDRSPRDIEDTRDYMEGLTELAAKYRIDLTVLHGQKTT